MLNSYELKKRHAANAALYLNIDEYRRRTFLRRNLHQALDDHSTRLASGPGTSTAIKSNALNEARIASTALSAQTPDYPNKQMLDQLIEQQKPVLQIHIKSLQPPRPKEAQNHDERPRKRVKHESASCHVEIRVKKLHDDPKSERIKNTCTNGLTTAEKCREKRSLDETPGVDVYRDRRPSKIILHRLDNGETHFEFDTNGPLLISVEKLYVTVTRNGRFKSTLDKYYALSINIDFDSSEDAALVVPLLTHSDCNPPHSNQPARIETTWSLLPKCPEAGRHLRPRLKRGEESRKLENGLDVDICWISPKSPMTAFNFAVRQAQAKRNRGAAPDLPSPPQNQVTVTFEILSKRFTVKGPRCPFCNRRSIGSFEKLHFHLIHSHELFKFDVKKTEKMSMDKVETVAYISASLAGPRPVKSSDRGFDNIVWIAPDTPFDITKYLGGDMSWSKGQQVNRMRESGRIAIERTGSRKQAQEKQTSSRYHPGATGSHVDSGRSAKYRVPAAPPGLSFFRTLSKRAIADGDMLSESDDDLDDNWLQIRKDHALSELSARDELFRPAELDFIKKLDRFLQTQSLSGDMNLGDSLTRFARTDAGGWLGQKSLRIAFRKKLRELRDDRLITEFVYHNCLRAANQRAKADKRPVDTPPSGPTDTTAINGIGSASDMASLKAMKTRLESIQQAVGNSKLSNEGLLFIVFGAEVGDNSEGLVGSILRGSSPFATGFPHSLSARAAKDTALRSERLISVGKALDMAAARLSVGQIERSTFAHRVDVALTALDTLNHNDMGGPPRRIAIELAFQSCENSLNGVGLLLLRDPNGTSASASTGLVEHQTEADEDGVMQDEVVVDIPAATAAQTVSSRHQATRPAESSEDDDDMDLDVSEVMDEEPAPDRSQAAAPWIAACICGRLADGANIRGTIACANPDCAQLYYHMSCVGLSARLSGWRCRACGPVEVETGNEMEM